MAHHVRDIMTAAPVTVGPQTSVAQAARLMRDHDLGAVLVTDDGRLRGLVTDRDLVVRSVAEGLDPEETTVVRACSEDLVTVRPDDELDVAVRLMREHAVRRVPVV
ncbi:CBS domain-containing protein, partial [Streptomyces werraensis]